MSAVVFLGPTLPRGEARDLLDARILPPARKGDVYQAVRTDRPKAIGLIDGAFREVRAVWHREILWALSQGVHVFGAASMGALRAAELDRFGMRGIGRVYAAYRDGAWPGYADEAFEDDDEVAVICAPPEAGGAALSDAMVDLRDTLVAAEAAGLITRMQRDALSMAMKRLPYAERSVARLVETAAQMPDPPDPSRLAAWLAANRVQRKRADAREMLETMARFLDGDPPPHAPGFAFQDALVWERFVAEADSDPPGFPTEAEALVLEELRLDPRAWRNAVRAAAGPPTPEPEAPDLAAPEMQRQLGRFRAARHLWRRQNLLAWLAGNALDESGLLRLLRQEAILDRMTGAGHPSLLPRITDQLRLSGALAPLLRRARAKQERLAALPCGGALPAGPEMDAALAWYGETRCGGAAPVLTEADIQAAGWRDRAAFEAAVWRDYLVRHPAAIRDRTGSAVP